MYHTVVELIIRMLAKLRKPEQKKLPVGITDLSLDLGPGMMAAAVSQIGLGERGANNSGMYVERYAAAVDKHTPLVWCASFVYYCYLSAAKTLGVASTLVRPSAGAKALCRNILSAGGRKLDKGETPLPGDVALWHRGAANSWTGHVGIVQGSNWSQKTFTCIEGNRGNFPSNVAVFGHSIGEAGLLGFYRMPKHELSNYEVIG